MLEGLRQFFCDDSYMKFIGPSASPSNTLMPMPLPILEIVASDFVITNAERYSELR